MVTDYIAQKFTTRWLVSSLGVWLAAELISGVSIDQGIGPVVLAGLILALANVLLRPLVIFLSLPALLLSLGLFMLVVNGFMVYIADALYDGLSTENFLSAVLAGVVITLVNYGVTLFFDKRGKNT